VYIFYCIHNATYCIVLQVQLPTMHRCTWMGDRLQAGKPYRYATSLLGQLSFPSLRGR